MSANSVNLFCFNYYYYTYYIKLLFLSGSIIIHVHNLKHFFVYFIKINVACKLVSKTFFMYYIGTQLNKYLYAGLVFHKMYLFFQRYYYYIHNGIDTQHVAPMEDSWLEHVLSQISNKLKVSLSV